MLILVVGPSGAGKDTLLDAARARLAGDARFRFARRWITRPQSAGGEDHVPIDDTAFERQRAGGGFDLWWRAHGLGYGIAAGIADDLAAGRVVVASVSRGVLEDAARRFPVRVVEITAPIALLAARLAARGRESAAEIAARLSRSVPLPAGLDVVRVMNDSTPEAGAARLLKAITGAQSG
jgi:ribose 1,5-bisphosphokinase